ncbi:MAG: SDR family NAD(P)-dependent oxidoreductase [Myxococcales bacterium]|nr:SDR family NAD(P)-dependent oxidoreductase [Myxococcales bacterium]
MEELQGRVAVVTGGASGIGRGMAEAFLAEGMHVVLGDIEAAPLAETTQALSRDGARVIGVECDVSKPESVEALRDAALSEFGKVHVVCNNAGVGGGGGAMWEASLDDWDWGLGVNLMGVIYGIRSFVPVMIEQGEGGHVVNTSSMAGLMPGMGIYGVTKHAVVALSESLWTELNTRGQDVGVSVLCPGWVRTRIVESERNRPEAPRPDPGPEAPQIEMMRKMIASFVEGGLDPLEVGRRVAQSIREKRFYVLTHPHWRNMIQNRLENILEGRDPVGIPPPPS